MQLKPKMLALIAAAIIFPQPAMADWPWSAKAAPEAVTLADVEARLKVEKQAAKRADMMAYEAKQRLDLAQRRGLPLRALQGLNAQVDAIEKSALAAWSKVRETEALRMKMFADSLRPKNEKAQERLATLPPEKRDEPPDSEIGRLRAKMITLEASLPSLEADCARDVARYDKISSTQYGLPAPGAYRYSDKDLKRAEEIKRESSYRLDSARRDIADADLKIRELQLKAASDAKRAAERAEFDQEEARKKEAEAKTEARWKEAHGKARLTPSVEKARLAPLSK